MARSGRFGTLPGAAPNLTATIVSLMEAYQNSRDRNILSAWQSGGKFEGEKVTDQRLMKWFRMRRDQYDPADPEYDYWDQQIKQTDYDIGESKMLLSLAQGNTSYGGAAKWYATNASRFPKNSEAWRAAMRASAQYRKAAQESKAAGTEISKSEQYNNAISRVERNVTAPADRALGLFNEMMVRSGGLADSSTGGVPGLNAASMAVGNEELLRWIETNPRGQRMADQWKRLTGQEFSLASVRAQARKGRGGAKQQAAIAKRFGYESYVAGYKERGRNYEIQAISIEMMRRDVLDNYDQAHEDMIEVLNDGDSTPQEKIQARETFAAVLDQIARQSGRIGDAGMEGRATNEARMYRGQEYSSVPTVGAERGTTSSGSGFSTGEQEHPIWAKDPNTGQEIVGTVDANAYGTNESDFHGAQARADLYVDEAMRRGELVRVYNDARDTFDIIPSSSFRGGKPSTLEHVVMPYYGTEMTITGPDGKPEKRDAFQNSSVYVKHPMTWQIGAGGLQSGEKAWPFAFPVSTWVVGGIRMYEYPQGPEGMLKSTTVAPFPGMGEMVQYQGQYLPAINGIQVNEKGEAVLTLNPSFLWDGSIAYDPDDPQAWATDQAAWMAAKAQQLAAPTPLYGAPEEGAAGLRPGQQAGETQEQYFQRMRDRFVSEKQGWEARGWPGTFARPKVKPEVRFEDWLQRQETGGTVPAAQADQEARQEQTERVQQATEVLQGEVVNAPGALEMPEELERFIDTLPREDLKALKRAGLVSDWKVNGRETFMVGTTAQQVADAMPGLRPDEKEALVTGAGPHFENLGTVAATEDQAQLPSNLAELGGTGAKITPTAGSEAIPRVAQVTPGQPGTAGAVATTGTGAGVITPTRAGWGFQGYGKTKATGIGVPGLPPGIKDPGEIPAVLSPMLWSNDSAFASIMSNEAGRQSFMQTDPQEFFDLIVAQNGWENAPTYQMQLARDIDNVRLATPKARSIADYYMEHPESATKAIVQDVNKIIATQAIARETSFASMVIGAKYGFGGRQPIREQLLNTGMTDEQIDQQYPELSGPDTPEMGQSRIYDPISGKVRTEQIAASQLDVAIPTKQADGSILPRLRSAISSDVGLRGDAALPRPDLMAPGGASAWVHDAVARGRAAFDAPKPINAPNMPSVTQPNILGPGAPGGATIKPPTVQPIKPITGGSIRYDRPVTTAGGVTAPAAFGLPSATTTSNIRRGKYNTGGWGAFSGGYYRPPS